MKHDQEEPGITREEEKKMTTLENILNTAKKEGKTLDRSTIAYTLGYAAGKKKMKNGTLIGVKNVLRRRKNKNNDA